MGEIVGWLIGTVVWTELWTWFARVLGARGRWAVLLGAGGAAGSALGLASYTGKTDLLVLYLVSITAWCGYRTWSVANAERTSRRRERPEAESESRERKCGTCGGKSEPDASFCDVCGARLGAIRCEACSTSNRPTAAHCKHCGVGLQVQRAPKRPA